MYVLKKEEGGRHTPFFPGYRPQFFIRTMDVTGEVILDEGVEMVMPGDNANLTIELIMPVALEVGSHFAIREGGRTVGAGVSPRSSNRHTQRSLLADPAMRASRISMAKKANRIMITLACTECKERNYTSEKNRKQRYGSYRAEQVLPALPQAHRASRAAIGLSQASSSIGRATVSKTVGCGFNSCLACLQDRYQTPYPDARWHIRSRSDGSLLWRTVFLV